MQKRNVWAISSHQIALQTLLQSQIFYKDALAALLVYDCTRPESFDAIAKWKGEIDEKVSLPNGDPLPVYLLANKVRYVIATLQRYFFCIDRACCVGSSKHEHFQTSGCLCFLSKNFPVFVFFLFCFVLFCISTQ